MSILTLSQQFGNFHFLNCIICFFVFFYKRAYILMILYIYKCIPFTLCIHELHYAYMHTCYGHCSILYYYYSAFSSNRTNFDFIINYTTYNKFHHHCTLYICTLYIYIYLRVNSL